MRLPVHLIAFKRPGQRCLELSGSVVKQLISYRQVKEARVESGGVLLGRILSESEDVIIDSITVPSRSDRATRFTFIREAASAQRLVTQSWISSNGTSNYLGEWHTHPEEHPLPSEVDFVNWQRIHRQCRREYDSLFFIIVGLSATRAWEVIGGSSGAETLELTLIG